MNKKKGIFLAVITLLLTSSLCLLLYRFDNKYTQPSLQPISGLLFLPASDLERTPVRFLTREWEYYPGLLASPEELGRSESYRTYLDIGEISYLTNGAGTYRLTLLLPDAETNYALELPEIFSAYRFYVNGEQVLQMGEPDPMRYRPQIASRMITFTASGRTELVLAVSDYSGIYSGLTYPPVFGKPSAVLTLRDIRLLVHSSGVLTAFSGMILSICFGIKGNRKRGILFTLCCLCLIGITGYPLLHTFFVTGYQPWYSIEIGSLYLLLLLAVLLQCDLCKLPGKFSLLLAVPCGIGLILSLMQSIGASFWSRPVSLIFSGAFDLVKLYSALCLIGLSAWALGKGTQYSAPLFCASISLAGFLLFDRLFPLYEPIVGGWFVEFGAVFLSLGLAAVLWNDAMNAYRFRLRYEEEYHQMERRLSMQKEHYKQLSGQVERTREAVHDLRHHMRALRTMAQQSETEKILAYLDAYEPHLAEREVTTFSAHPTADAILSYYAAAARKIGAVYDVRLSIPPDLNFPDDELCIILGNLLENALEAMANLPGERQLYLRGDASDGRFGLVVENSFDGKIQIHDGHYLSTKHAGYGLGLQSVSAIAEKYGGLADFSPEGTHFHASVMIPLSGQ